MSILESRNLQSSYVVHGTVVQIPAWRLCCSWLLAPRKVVGRGGEEEEEEEEE